MKEVVNFSRLGEAEEKIASEPKFSLLVVKQFIMAGVSDKLRAFPKERNVNEMTWDKFQAVSTAYQEAHGREAARKPVATPLQHNIRIWSGQCLSVLVEDTQTTLKQLTMPARDDFIREHWLCFNCLRPGHPAKYCRSPARCAICKRWHHTLLHLDQEPPQLIISSVICQTAPVHLITTATTVASRRGMATARVFFDHSLQVSFVAANQAERVGAKCLGYRRIELAGLGSQPSVYNVCEYEVELIGVDGRPHEVTAQERVRLDLRIPPVTQSTIERWQQ